jgi:hypothetical protein
MGRALSVLLSEIYMQIIKLIILLKTEYTNHI